MKKTLIALAAVAATGAAFAQSSVTLSGALGFGYEARTIDNANGTKSKRTGLADMAGDIKLTAVEDLGGGLKLTMQTQLDHRGRGTSVAAEDASLTLSGGFGSVMIGAVESGNGILGLGGAGAVTYGLDGAVIAAASNVNLLRYTSPDLFAGFKAYVSLLDATGAGGMESSAGTPDGSQIGFTYADGPLALAGDYTSFGRNNMTAQALTTPDDRVRISGAYDLGVARIGAGFESRDSTATSNNTVKDYIIGVNIPVGAMSFGLNYARSKTEGAAFSSKGYDLVAKYDLSKRTYIAFQYQSVDNVDLSLVDPTSSANRRAVNVDSERFRVRLNHTF